jgi:hypothetical protein
MRLIVPALAALLAVGPTMPQGLAAEGKVSLTQIMEACLSLGRARGWTRDDFETNRRARRFFKNCVRGGQRQAREPAPSR